MWTSVSCEDGVHTIPDDDLIVHTESAGCFCNPEVKEFGVHGQWVHTVRKLIIHHAMDGRE